MIKVKTITEFFQKDKPAFANYDNLRKIPNYIDGLKISQRKLIWTAFEKCDKEFIKTETFANLTSLRTNYIHGSASLCSVITGLVQNFPGTANYQYLIGNTGGWGCRILPVASAPRYTRIKLAQMTNILFNSVDRDIIEKQYFEGMFIEPQFMLPIFPTIFLNPSSGISTGFSSNIYPRNPNEIIEYIKKRINGTEKPRMELLPWFKGHLGKVEYNQKTGRNESFGIITKNNMTSYTITELPIGMEYQKYIDFLNKLEDDNVIQSFEDLCDPKTDKILINIKTLRSFTRQYEDEYKLYEVFRLVRNLPETLCCIDENNRVREFRSIQEILDAFINIRLKHYTTRKQWLLNTIKTNLEELVSKYLFIKGIIEKEIIVANKKKDDIIKQLEKIEKIIKRDNSYLYLLNMPIHSLTKEKLEELKKQIKDAKELFTITKETTIEKMWLTDLNEFRKTITI